MSLPVGSGGYKLKGSRKCSKALQRLDWNMQKYTTKLKKNWTEPRCLECSCPRPLSPPSNTTVDRHSKQRWMGFLRLTHDFCTMAAGGVRHVNMWRFSVRCRVAQIYHWGSLIAAFITFTITALFSRLHLLAHRSSFFVPIFKVQVISIRDLHEGGRRQTVREIRAERKLSLYPSSLPPTHPFYPPATSSRPLHVSVSFSSCSLAFSKTVKHQADSGSTLPTTLYESDATLWKQQHMDTHS